METLITHFVDLFRQAAKNWHEGGWCMPIMAVNALIMFSLGLHILFTQKSKNIGQVKEKTWRRWIDHPNERKGTTGEMITYITSASSVEDLDRLVAEVRASDVTPFERELRVMGISSTAAPLIGLLGTVTGILTLFAALARGSGGEETMKLIAQGVSEALIATQTGLVIALPGLIFHHFLQRRHESFKAMLETIQTVCAQRLFKKKLKSQPVDARSFDRSVVKAK